MTRYGNCPHCGGNIDRDPYTWPARTVNGVTTFVVQCCDCGTLFYRTSNTKAEGTKNHEQKSESQHQIRLP